MTIYGDDKAGCVNLLELMGDGYIAVRLCILCMCWGLTIGRANRGRATEAEVRSTSLFIVIPTKWDVNWIKLVMAIFANGPWGCILAGKCDEVF